jgi:hypothetical protein
LIRGRLLAQCRLSEKQFPVPWFPRGAALDAPPPRAVCRPPPQRCRQVIASGSLPRPREGRGDSSFALSSLGADDSEFGSLSETAPTRSRQAGREQRRGATCNRRADGEGGAWTGPLLLSSMMVHVLMRIMTGGGGGCRARGLDREIHIDVARLLELQGCLERLAALDGLFEVGHHDV